MKLKDIEGLPEASVYVEVGGELLSIGSSYQKIKGNTAQVVLVPSKPRAPRAKAVPSGPFPNMAPAINEEVTGGTTDASA